MNHRAPEEMPTAGHLTAALGDLHTMLCHVTCLLERADERAHGLRDLVGAMRAQHDVAERFVGALHPDEPLDTRHLGVLVTVRRDVDQLHREIVALAEALHGRSLDEHLD